MSVSSYGLSLGGRGSEREWLCRAFVRGGSLCGGEWSVLVGRISLCLLSFFRLERVLVRALLCCSRSSCLSGGERLGMIFPVGSFGDRLGMCRFCVCGRSLLCFLDARFGGRICRLCF